MTFTGFPPAAFDLYAGLQQDNSKAYWTAHKEVYERAVREPFEALLGSLAEEFGEGHAFRPYRDVRFSADKSPYKDHQGASVGGHGAIGRYVAVTADGMRAAGGWYLSAPDQVARYRAAVDDDDTGTALVAALGAVTAAGLEVGGDLLATRPRGVSPDHVRLELLRHRTLYASREWPRARWMSTPAAETRVRDAWRAMAPLLGWLEQHVGPSQTPRPEQRRERR